jgi:hypothetical protein
MQPVHGAGVFGSAQLPMPPDPDADPDPDPDPEPDPDPDPDPEPEPEPEPEPDDAPELLLDALPLDEPVDPLASLEPPPSFLPASPASSFCPWKYSVAPPQWDATTMSATSAEHVHEARAPIGRPLVWPIPHAAVEAAPARRAIAGTSRSAPSP